jgi:hypothetical protein
MGAAGVPLLEVVASGGHGVGDVCDAEDVTAGHAGVGVEGGDVGGDLRRRLAGWNTEGWS